MSAATVEQEQELQELSVREVALQEMRRLQGRAAAAEAKRDADRLEADRLEESAGADLLDDDDPDAGDRLAARVGTLRASASMQDRVAAEASARALTAAAAALRAEAEELSPALVAAVSDLEAFDAKTERLAAALAKHTGGKVRVVLADEEALDALRDGSATRVEYPTPPRLRLERVVEDAQARVDLASGLAAVVGGQRSMGDLRDSFVGAGRTARWDQLPQLVREGTVPVDGLDWVAPAPDLAPRDWQGEYDQEKADLQAARDRLAGAVAGRASQRIEERREALKVDLFAVERTVAFHEDRMRSIAEQAEALDGVTVM